MVYLISRERYETWDDFEKDFFHSLDRGGIKTREWYETLTEITLTWFWDNYRIGNTEAQDEGMSDLFPGHDEAMRAAGRLPGVATVLSDDRLTAGGGGGVLPDSANPNLIPLPDSDDESDNGKRPLPGVTDGNDMQTSSNNEENELQGPAKRRREDLDVGNAEFAPGPITDTSFDWHTGDLELVSFPKIEPEDVSPCAVACKAQRENCAVLRKRAAMFLKQKGCPSLVTSRKKRKC